MKGGSNAEPLVGAEFWGFGGKWAMQYQSSTFVDNKKVQETHTSAFEYYLYENNTISEWLDRLLPLVCSSLSFLFGLIRNFVFRKQN